MSPLRCARSGQARRSAGRGFLGTTVAAALIGLTLPGVGWCADPPPQVASATEPIVARVVLNTEDRGDLFVARAADGDFLVKATDLASLGLTNLDGSTALVDGEPHVSLRSVQGLVFRFDERTAQLSITAEPRLLAASRLTLASSRSPVRLSAGTSAYLNYALTASGGASSGDARPGLATEAGWRSGNTLFLTDAITVERASGIRPVRLTSALSHEDPATLQRLVVGDFLVPGRDLSVGYRLAGVSISKAYSLDPYFIRFPTQSVRGSVAVPTELEVYIDGQRVRSERIRPGEFELSDIVSYGGARSVEVVLRDAFGRIQQLDYSFYFTEQPLQPGLHDYSYNLGTFRRNLGLTSGDYGSVAASAFHRYGFNRWLTLGARLDATRAVSNAGPTATVVLGSAGVLNVSVLGSRLDGRQGAAAALSYGYQARRWSAGMSLRAEDRDFAAVAERPLRTNRRREASLGASWRLGNRDTLSLNHSFLTTRPPASSAAPEPEDGQNIAALSARRVTSLTYTRPLVAGRASLISSISHVKQALNGSHNEVFLALNIPFGFTHSVGTNVRTGGGQTTGGVRLVKSQPRGEGLGYAIATDVAEDAQRTSRFASADVQYNAPSAVARAEYRRLSVGQGSDENYRLSLASNLSYVDGHLAAGRPVTGGFAVVKVGELAGVDVLVNGQPAARTGIGGRAYLPSLTPYYEETISLRPSTIPIDYSLAALNRKLVLPERGGALVDFPVTRIQAVAGVLKRQQPGGEAAPVQYAEGAIDVGGQPVLLQTGRGGEFYLENIPPGRYAAWVNVGQQRCAFELTIPPSTEALTELPPVLCTLQP